MQRKFLFMEKIYVDTARVLKAISDPKRLRIIDMLSCQEMPVCEILKPFQISQPTLSHDLKVLAEAGLVNVRKEGKNIFYSIRREGFANLRCIVDEIITPKDNCVCEKEKR